jgi:hypothetical protein
MASSSERETQTGLTERNDYMLVYEVSVCLTCSSYIEVSYTSSCPRAHPALLQQMPYCCCCVEMVLRGRCVEGVEVVDVVGRVGNKHGCVIPAHTNHKEARMRLQYCIPMR